MSLSIINYHGVERHPSEYVWEEGEQTYVLSLDDFERQLENIVEAGVNIIDIKEIMHRLNSKQPDAAAVLLTFDDGHRSHLQHVLPSLKKRGMRGVFFISAGLVGQGDLLNWQGLEALKREGMEIGSHGLKHIPLSGLSDKEISAEMSLSKSLIEEKLGIEVSSFSVPKGFYQPRMSRIAEACGYRYMFTSNFGINLFNEDRHALKRMAVKKSTTPADFEKMIKGRLGWKKYSEGAKAAARCFLPAGFYERLAVLKKAVAK